MSVKDEPADFNIISEPTHITFICPHCNISAAVDFGLVDEPRSWSDDWGYIECPSCEEQVRLGEYEYM